MRIYLVTYKDPDHRPTIFDAEELLLLLLEREIEMDQIESCDRWYHSPTVGTWYRDE
jgi:hypothetical protein